jgi:hypothetical protein
MQRRLLLLSLLLACGEGGDWCRYGRDFTPGTFTSPGGQWVGAPGVFRHAGVGAKTLVLRHVIGGHGLVTITYERNGKKVVETWKASLGSDVQWTTPAEPHVEIRANRTGSDFGSVYLGQEWAQADVVRVTNVGNRPVSATLATSNPAFSATTNCSDVPPNAECRIDVTFRPRVAGPINAELTITPGPGKPITVSLTGTGLVPDAGATIDTSPDVAAIADVRTPPDSGPD